MTTNAKDKKVRQNEAVKRYRKAHPTRHINVVRNWEKKNPEKPKQYKLAISYRFKQLLRVAKQRNHELTLTFEEYSKILSSQKCEYCSDILPKSGSSLDRVDSFKGYHLDNVVPCCRECNRIKSNTLTYHEMVAVATLLKNMRST